MSDEQWELFVISLTVNPIKWKMKAPLAIQSKQFALEIIRVYKNLIERKEFVLSRQLLKSGTSIGANVREGQNAESSADFIHKFSIAQKEAAESSY